MNLSMAASAVSIVGALSLVGCGNKEAQLTGKWKIKSMPDLSNAQGVQGNAMAQSVLQSMSKSMAIEFKPDKHYTMTMIIPIDGDWSISGNTVTMKATKMAGMDMAQIKKMAASNPQAQASLDKNSTDMTASLSDDGKTLTVNSKNGSGSAMTFEKAS